ncbi:efflux transporter outer membrane subunit [bacterium]|nr:efflux transporter outer membrane subunit [bacterium]
MNTKKFLATSLVMCMLGMNMTPAYAFKLHFTPLKFPHREKKQAVVKTAPTLTTSVNEYRYTNVNMDWWKNYNDPILSGYITRAIEQNQDMQIATIKVEEARQAVKMQFARELPSLSIGFSPALYKTPGSTSSIGSLSIPFLASYEVDYLGKNHTATKAVKKVLDEAKFQERAVYIAIASEIGSDYINIVNLDKQIEIQQKLINSRKQIFNLMKLRNREGITSTADLVRANKAYVMANSDMTSLKKERSILLNALAVLIGESPENAYTLKRTNYNKLMFASNIPTSIPTEIIVQRPDYLAAEAEVEKVGFDVKVAKKELLPSFNILGLAMLAVSSTYSEMSWRSALAALAGSINWDAYAGGAKVANVKLKKAEYEAVLQNYYKTNLNAIKEVNDTLTSLKLDNDKYNKDLESYNMQKTDFGYMNTRYKQGAISYLDLEQQKENLYSLERLVVSSNISNYIDRISLYKAVGGKM